MKLKKMYDPEHLPIKLSDLNKFIQFNIYKKNFKIKQLQQPSNNINQFSTIVP